MRPLERAVAREPRFEPGLGFYARVGILGFVAAVGFGALLLRLWSLQVLQHPLYARVALSQASRVVPVPAGRGPIIDSKGRLLAGTEARVVVARHRSERPMVRPGDRAESCWRDRDRRALARASHLGGACRERSQCPALDRGQSF